jgi:hypothetical protein
MSRILLLSSLLAASVAAGPSDDSELPYTRCRVNSPSHPYGFEAPEGWEIHCAPGNGTDLPVIAFPRGATFQAAATVIYAHDVRSTDPLQKLVEQDIVRTARRSPDVGVRDGDPIRTAAGPTATVRLFEKDRHGNHEAVAYLKAGDLFVTVALSSRTRAGFDASYPKFRKLVSTFEAPTRGTR